MKIAVLGGGFTGLTAALRLLQNGHEVTLIEKEGLPGGLAGGFKKPNWQWTLEKSYHHWFTNDQAVLNLAKELDYRVIITRPQTNIYIKGKILPIDSPSALLSFPFLPPIDKARAALSLAYLKLNNHYQSLEGKKAMSWIRRFMGQKTMDLIWEPLFKGKFGDYKEEVALTWFWGRIKKRTPFLVYPQGGFQEFAHKIAEKIEHLGGRILLNTEVLNVKSKPLSVTYRIRHHRLTTVAFDKIISTLPTPVFTKIVPGLPPKYYKNISSIPHLSAQNLILMLKKPFLSGSYWLNINDPGFPFLLLAEHTNFMDSKNYGGESILYIGNYLPNDHPYLQMSAPEILKIFKPFLQKINPNYKLQTIDYRLFSQPFAQPVVDVNYFQKIPQFQTPIEGLFLANMDMVYPWDRETNYAVEMGEKIAELVDNRK